MRIIIQGLIQFNISKSLFLSYFISKILFQKYIGMTCTLGLLPKISFKLTQSIHVALKKSCNFDWKLLKLFIFNTKTNKGEIGLYFENNEKMLGGATSQKSQK